MVLVERRVLGERSVARLTIEEIEELKAKLQPAVKGIDSHLRLSNKQALYLDQLLHSHLVWRKALEN